MALVHMGRVEGAARLMAQRSVGVGGWLGRSVIFFIVRCMDKRGGELSPGMPGES